MDRHVLRNLPSHEVFPGYHGRFVHGNRMTQAHWDIQRGHAVPEHSHPHEQLLAVIDGRFELTVDGETVVLNAGTVVVIPGGVPHGGRALSDCRLVDTFSPTREDYRDDD